MLNTEAKQWEAFNARKVQTNYPQWPNEAMLKIIFGNYLEHKITITEGSRVLDIGCGFGNNLLPFLKKGCACFATEVTAPMAAQTKQILKEQGYSVDAREGTNARLPFEDKYFDLILSINVIHYEGEDGKIQAALKEYRRVLKDHGSMLMLTVGPEHTIIKKAKKEDHRRYRIQDHDFRDGTYFYCFEDLQRLKENVEQYFVQVEVGRVTERLMKYDLDFFIAVGRAGEQS